MAYIRKTVSAFTMDEFGVTGSLRSNSDSSFELIDKKKDSLLHDNPISTSTKGERVFGKRFFQPKRTTSFVAEIVDSEEDFGISKKVSINNGGEKSLHLRKSRSFNHIRFGSMSKKSKTSLSSLSSSSTLTSIISTETKSDTTLVSSSHSISEPCLLTSNSFDTFHEPVEKENLRTEKRAKKVKTTSNSQVKSNSAKTSFSMNGSNSTKSSFSIGGGSSKSSFVMGGSKNPKSSKSETDTGDFSDSNRSTGLDVYTFMIDGELYHELMV